MRICLGILLCALAWHGPASAAPAGARPNVLMIAVDDLRPELGCYGNARVKSPNIDALASRGMLFERAYCQQAVCGPTRASLLSGCRPDSTRVHDNLTDFRAALPDIATLPGHFKANGYRAISLSKVFHNGFEDAPRSWSEAPWYPEAPHYATTENREMTKRLLAEAKAKAKKAGKPAEKVKVKGPAFECADLPDNAYSDGETADKAIELLGQLKGQPFFLAVGFYKPHLAFVAPKKYWDLYDRAALRLAVNPSPPEGCPAIAATDWSELRHYQGIPKEGPLPDDLALTLVHGYLACVSFTDAQIGRVLAELKRQGIEENTIVVLWGDHGWKLGEHGMWCKHTNFELDCHAPLLVAAPGRGIPGARSRALVEFVDIYPTLCDLAGLSKPAHLEGLSFAPLLDQPDRNWKTAAFSQYPRNEAMGYSVRSDSFRYTEWRAPSGQIVATELYDHRSDHAENSNVAASVAPDQIATLAALLKAGWKGALPQDP
jgi:iduronate 2-sulfatase